MDRMWIIIGLGGFIGSVARYFTMLAAARIIPTAMPWGFVGINVLGSLVIGVVFGLSQRYEWLTPQWALFLGAGICGGFTTFSAFSLETMHMLQRGLHMQAALYILASIVLCIGAAWLGHQFIINRT